MLAVAGRVWRLRVVIRFLLPTRERSWRMRDRDAVENIPLIACAKEPVGAAAGAASELGSYL